MKRDVRLALLCSVWLGLGASAQAHDVDQRLAQRIQAVQREYETARQAAAHHVDQRLGIDYEALDRRYREHDRIYREQLAIVEKIQDEPAKQQKIKALQAAFVSPEYLQYAEARLVLENELERDHLLRARCLQAYEAILDEVISADPLLGYFFRSSEYRSRYGLLLKRVVWQVSTGESASTKSLTTYAVFADRTRTPFLITISPLAFSSLSFLRSILIHELNHVVLEKDPRFAQAERLSSLDERLPSQAMTSDRYRLVFNLRHGQTTGYQYHVLHEYYSFRAQLLYDDAMPPTPNRRLSPLDRKRIEQLCQWAEHELGEQNRVFVQAHPAPPIASYFQHYTIVPLSER